MVPKAIASLRFSSKSSSPKAAASAAIIVSLKALRTSGRLSQRTATPRPAWISMVSCLMPKSPRMKLLRKSLTRLDDHPGPHRIGDETFLVGLVVQLGEHCRRRRRGEFDRGPQGDSRHRHATFGILFEHAFGIVDVPVDGQLHRRGEAHEPEHVTG